VVAVANLGDRDFNAAFGRPYNLPQTDIIYSLYQEGGIDVGKGKRVKTKRRKQRMSDKLQVPSLQNYPEGVPNYLRRMSTESGETLMEDQEWITLPKKDLDLHLDSVTPQGIVTTVNGKFKVFAIPACTDQLSYDNECYDGCRLVKGTGKDFAVNKTATFHVGTPKFYHDLESADNSSQKDPNEGRIQMGKDTILEFQDPESKDWISLPHEGIAINYGHGYIYCCSMVEGDEIPPYEYDTYTIFNATPQRIALALGIDVGNHLIKKGCKITGTPEIRVFYGKVSYMGHEEQSNLYQRGAVLSSSGKFREDLVAIFTKIPKYSHQKEFRFFITLDNAQWDFESHSSLEVAMSPNFQFHFGYTYWADEHEQNRNPKKEASAQ